MFGHQAYAVNFKYELYPGSLRRLKEQKLLRRREWNDELDKIARKAGWTHVLLTKRVPYVSAVPGEMVYDSPEFVVIALQRSRK